MNEVQKTGRTALALAGALVLGTAAARQARADVSPVSGDLRVRHEDFFNKGVNAVDRHRERFRLRFGVTGTIQDFTAAFKLASGTGEQTSTNQTFGNSFSQKGIYIDQAYLQWRVRERLKLTGGRMPNPIWRTYSSDVMWDTDINPEGYAEQVELPAGDGERLSLFANFAQLPLNEIGGSNADPWMFAHQIGADVQVADDVRLKMAVAQYSFINERKSVLVSTAAADSALIQEANTRVAGSAQLASAFHIIDWTAELTFHLASLPVALQADFVRNVAPGNDLLSAQRTNGQNTGYQYGLILGKAKNKGSWEAAYFRKWLQANATVSDWADADFGSGGTNRQGHIFWLAYAVRDYLTVQGKYFVTSKLNPQISSTAPYGAASNDFSDINRFQADVVMKF